MPPLRGVRWGSLCRADGVPGWAFFLSPGAGLGAGFVSAAVQQHPDYHEGWHVGLRGDLDALRNPYEKTPEYCAGYDAGHGVRQWLGRAAK
jgi:hypothetical protein